MAEGIEPVGPAREPASSPPPRPEPPPEPPDPAPAAPVDTVNVSQQARDPEPDPAPDSVPDLSWTRPGEPGADPDTNGGLPGSARTVTQAARAAEYEGIGSNPLLDASHYHGDPRTFSSHLEETDRALRALPPDVQADLEAAGFRAVPTQSHYDYATPGTDIHATTTDGRSLRQAGGYYDYGAREAVVVEFPEDPYTGRPSRNPDTRYTTLHETGHAHGDVTGATRWSPTNDPAYLQAWRADASDPAIPDGNYFKQTGVLDSHPNGTVTPRGATESYADGFAQRYGSAPHPAYQGKYPGSDAWMDANLPDGRGESALTRTNRLLNHPGIEKLGGGAAIAGGAIQSYEGAQLIQNGETVDGVAIMTAGGLNVYGGAATLAGGAAATTAAPIAFGGAALLEGGVEYVNGVEAGDRQQAGAGMLKSVGGTMMIVGGGAAATGVGLVPGAMVAGMGGILYGAGAVYEMLPASWVQSAPEPVIDPMVQAQMIGA